MTINDAHAPPPSPPEGGGLSRAHYKYPVIYFLKMTTNNAESSEVNYAHPTPSRDSPKKYEKIEFLVRSTLCNFEGPLCNSVKQLTNRTTKLHKEGTKHHKAFLNILGSAAYNSNIRNICSKNDHQLRPSTPTISPLKGVGSPAHVIIIRENISFLTYYQSRLNAVNVNYAHPTPP